MSRSSTIENYYEITIEQSRRYVDSSVSANHNKKLRENQEGNIFLPQSTQLKIDKVFRKFKTIIVSARDSKRAKRIGRKHGNVVSCEKVDFSYYLNKIEHLNVTEKPIEFTFDKEEYVLNKAMELSRPTKSYSGKKYSVEIIDNE